MQVGGGPQRVDGSGQGRATTEETGTLASAMRTWPASIRRESITVQNIGSGLNNPPTKANDGLWVSTTVGGRNGVFLDFLESVTFERIGPGQCEWNGPVYVSAVVGTVDYSIVETRLET